MNKGKTMPTPKSILLHLDNSAHAAQRIQVAQQLADAFDAQVSTVPCVRSALMRYPFSLESGAQAVEIMKDLDLANRNRMHAAFTAAAAGSPRLHWTEPLADAPWGLVRRALYADLMILGQRDGDDPAADDLPADFLPSLLIESGRPALVLPYIGAPAAIGRTVLVAWKETREAARALTAALPWLRRAQQVHAICYGEDADAALRSLRDHLAAQGVAATVHAQGAETRDAGNDLLSRAADLGADLLVMGCYGHSRTREWVLGGVTRAILASMTVPVLMVH